MEVRGKARGTSVDLRGCYHGLPWNTAGFHGKGHGSWRFHGQCHGCGPGTCHGYVRGKLRGTKHVNPRTSPAITTVISADVKPQQCPRPSAATRGYCHGNLLTRVNYRGRPRQLPRQFPLTSNYSNFNGHQRYSSDTMQLPQKSTTIATAISTAFQGHPRQLNCYVNRR